jgi:hypothetical protein
MKPYANHYVNPLHVDDPYKAKKKEKRNATNTDTHPSLYKCECTRDDLSASLLAFFFKDFIASCKRCLVFLPFVVTSCLHKLSKNVNRPKVLLTVPAEKCPDVPSVHSTLVAHHAPVRTAQYLDTRQQHAHLSTFALSFLSLSLHSSAAAARTCVLHLHNLTTCIPCKSQPPTTPLVFVVW